MITKLQVKFFLSQPRFDVYLKLANQDFDKALRLYQSNIELSEAFYPILSLIEISLRNAINERMKFYFNDPFWFKNCLPIDFQTYVATATSTVKSKNKNITADNIIAELNFGFWSRLFNRYHAKLLWKPLRLIFSNIPKHLRQRDKIDTALYRIRTLRNKVYHYANISDNFHEAELLYNEMFAFLIWLDQDLPDVLGKIDRFRAIHSKATHI